MKQTVFFFIHEKSRDFESAAAEPRRRPLVAGTAATAGGKHKQTKQDGFGGNRRDPEQEVMSQLPPGCCLALGCFDGALGEKRKRDLKVWRGRKNGLFSYFFYSPSVFI